MTTLPLNLESRENAGVAGADAVSAGRLWGIISPTGLVIAGVVGAAFITLFWTFLIAQHRYASEQAGDWSHAYFVPLISVYLLWQQRQRIAVTPAFFYWPGIVVVLLSVACYVFFLVGAPNHMGQGWSAVLCVLGLVLLLTGPRITQIAFMPIVYLSMGVTISDRIMNMITWPLQNIAAQGAFVLLTILGVNVTIAGNQITVTNDQGTAIPLNVAEACSGMRMVIAFVALGLAVALVAVKPWWQRILLIVLGVPVAIFMNVIRVAVLGYASLTNPQLATGGAHMFIGTLLLIPGFLLYLGIVWALQKAVVEEKKPATKAPAKGAKKPAGSAVRVEPVRWATLAAPAVLTAFAVLAISAGTLSAAVAALGIYLKKLPIEPPEGRVVASITKETPRWVAVGQDVLMSAEIVEELGTKNYLSRHYAQKTDKEGEIGKRVELHLAYYTGKIDTVPHVPDRCMVGAGWQLDGNPTDIPVKLDMDRMTPAEAGPMAPADWAGRLYTARIGGERIIMPLSPQNLQIRVTRFKGPGQSKPLHAGYFFIANGGHVSSPEGVRLLAFQLTDDYAYYLKVQVSSGEVETSEELAQLAGNLLDDLLPEIMRCVPDWVEVQSGRYPPGNRRATSTPK